MKIVFLNKYQDKVNRGAETFVSELAKRLSKHNSVDVVSNINYQTLLRNKYDVIVPTNGRLQVLIVRVLTWLTRSKMVVSGQSGAGFDDRINLYVFPDLFIGLTKYQSNWAKKVNPFVRIETIPNGVDPSTFIGLSSKGIKNSAGKIMTVLSVGAFTKEKRHDLTIKAVSKLDNVKLIIVGGGGDYKKEIYELGIKNLGKSRFEILTTEYNKMPEVYRKADVLAFPTVPWESFGIAIVEAMASGLPVVATDDPIRREIVGDAGILVDPTNTEEYANALRKALNVDWGDKPRNQAKKFSWDTIAESYEKLLNSLLKECYIII